MKFKKIKVEKYRHIDGFGEIVIPYVEVLFDSSEKHISVQNFDQEKHDYSLTAMEIYRISQISARRFYDENVAAVLCGQKVLSSKEINGVKDFLKLNGAEFGKLIGLDKSSVSRLLSENQNPQRDKMILMMERLREELDHPNISKIILGKLYEASKIEFKIESVNAPALHISEFFIRRFIETESPITNLKLQKLLYYAQGIGYGRCDLKLMREPFLAWDHGPVIKEIYDTYKVQGPNHLPVNNNLDLNSLLTNETIVNILEETISLYGIYDAWFLRNKTHQEKPWLETAKDDAIEDELMISFFKRALV